MHPIFVSPHPPAALCSDACLQPRTFSCFQSSGSPAPIPFLCSHSCCSPTGDGAAEGGLLRVFLPGRKLPPPSVLETCNTAKLVLKDGLLPKFLGDRPALKCNKEGKIGCCSPDPSLSIVHWWERGKRVKITAVSTGSLKKAGCADHSQEGELLPFSGWPRLETLGTETHTRSCVENLALGVFWIDNCFQRFRKQKSLTCCSTWVPG